MKTYLISSIVHRCIIVLTCLLAPCASQAEVRIRISVKVILGPGSPPAWPDRPGATLNLNSEEAIRDNVAFANRLLTTRGSSFQFRLRNNTIYTVAGQDDPWFTVPPKGNGDVKDGEANIKVLTDTATADATSKATWKWHDDSVNIYLNNGSSGRCCGSFLNTIFIGGSAYDELLIHELGHFLSLQHTHGNFNEDGDLDDWNDGDGFSQTLADDPDATAADIAAQYPGASQATVDALSRNIMSYHQDENDLDRFVWQQREAMIGTFNIDKSYAASGKARIVNSDGDDSMDGLTVDNRLETLQKAVDLSTSPNDVALVGGSVHDVANGMVISTPITLLPWRSPVIIK